MTRRPKPTPRLLLLVAGLSSFILLGAGQAVMGPALPVFETRFAIDTATASWLISSLGIGSFGGLVGLYFLGHIVTPRMALLAMAAGAALLALGPGFLPTVAGGALFGLGFGSVAALFNVRILAAFGTRGPSMVSLLNAGYSVGAIAAPLMFVGLGSNPTLIFGIISAMTALTILLTGSAGGTASARPVPGKDGFRFHVPILAFGLVAIGIEVSLSGLGPSAMIRAGIPATRAAELLSAFFLAFLAGRLGLTLLADRLPSFAIFTFAALTTALCAFGCALIDPGWFFVPMGFCAGMYFPGYFVTAVAKMGSDVRVAPVVLATTQIGAVSAPLIVAQVLPMMGDRGFFWLVAVTSLALGLTALLGYRRMSADTR